MSLMFPTIFALGIVFRAGALPGLIDRLGVLRIRGEVCCELCAARVRAINIAVSKRANVAKNKVVVSLL